MREGYAGLGHILTADTRQPEEKLADLMARQMLVTVPPLLLRIFILDHWSKVSALAHQIHDAPDRYAYLEAGDG